MNKRQVNAQITRQKLIDSVKELLKTKSLPWRLLFLGSLLFLFPEMLRSSYFH